MKAKRPNILMITTDQQRFDTISAAGFSFMKTPNLDRLCKEGCLYTHAYSPNPVCIPARHNLLTGLPCKYHGFDDNYFSETRNIPYQLPTFAQLLSDAEYDTVAIGKMHFQPYRRHNGFHRLFLMDEIARFREDDDYALYLQKEGYGNIQSMHGVRHMLYMLPQRSLLPIEHHGSTWVANKTIEILEENHGKRPFMIWTGFIEPHPPFDVPAEWADLYKNQELPEPIKSVTPLSTIAEENKHIADYPTEDYLKRARELYFASISFVDHQIGRILDKLEEIGELDNTMILFTSDHGEMMGDLGTFQKFLPYEFSSHIPMIIRYPDKVKAGSKDHRFVDLNDILPTMLDVADVEYPKQALELPGESIFAKNPKKNRDIQYVEHCKGNRRWVSLCSKNYKYNYYYGGGHEELFDMINDPYETTNLLQIDLTENVIKTKNNLRKQLVEIESRWGLDGYVINNDFKVFPEYVSKPYREMNFPIFPNYLVHDDEINFLNKIEDEIFEAIKDEPVVDPLELDLETFKSFSGFDDERMNKFITKAKKRKNDF